MNQAKELKTLIEQIFADGLVDPAERDSLSAMTEKMEEEVVTAVFREFIHEKWGEAMQDDVITPQERNLLGKVMMELGLQLAHLPKQAQLALKDAIPY